MKQKTKKRPACRQARLCPYDHSLTPDERHERRLETARHYIGVAKLWAERNGCTFINSRKGKRWVWILPNGQLLAKWQPYSAGLVLGKGEAVKAYDIMQVVAELNRLLVELRTI